MGRREEQREAERRKEKGLRKAISALLGWFCKLWASRASSVHPSRAKPRTTQQHCQECTSGLWPPDSWPGSTCLTHEGLAFLAVQPVPGQKRTGSHLSQDGQTAQGLAWWGQGIQASFLAQHMSVISAQDSWLPSSGP